MTRTVARCCAVWAAITAAVCCQAARAQTVEGDILRGQGAFLRGAGWYNLNTARANSINVDTTIRWKADLRKIQQERRELEAQKQYQKNQNVAEVRLQRAQRERELRTNPSPQDVQTGAALNALVYDLTDPDLTSNRWRSVSPVPLPPGASVKELIFAFTPHSVSSQASAALSRGVIALSRLDIKERWPVLLKKDELSKERAGYEAAYLRVKEKVLRGDYAVEEILGLDAAIDSLKRKITAEIPEERGFRLQAQAFANDLRDATRMFDANSVDYAREILIDTQDHDAANVEELVAFMTKYRLQFANSERSPTARALYGQIYEKLAQQATALGIKPDAAAAPFLEKTAASVKPAVPAPRGRGAHEPKGSPGFLPVNAEGKPLNLSFEDGTLADWQTTGAAFQGQPAKRNQVGPKGKTLAHTGAFLIDGFTSGGDKPRGTLTSEPFVVTHPFASFLIGGGGKPDTRVEIVTADDDKVFHTARGNGRPGLHPVVVDLRNVMGQRIFIRLVDQVSEGWGHVKFDDFRLHQTEPKFP